jgi:hypothetical protein
MTSKNILKSVLVTTAASAMVAALVLAACCVFQWNPPIEGWWVVTWQGVLVSILVSLSSVIVATRLRIRLVTFPLFFGAFLALFSTFGWCLCGLIAEFVTSIARQGRVLPADTFFNANWTFDFVWEKWFIVIPCNLAVYATITLMRLMKEDKPRIERLGCGQAHDASAHQQSEHRAIAQQPCKEIDDGVMLNVSRDSTVNVEIEN